MIEFFQSETGIATAISAVVTISVMLGAHLLRGRVNLIAFSPNSSVFQFDPPADGAQPIQVHSGQVMIQNLGRLPAKNVEVVAGQGVPPAGYNVVPPIDHSTGQTEQGLWIVRIPYIAPKEVITLQILNGPRIDSVRCEGGAAKFVPVIHQRIYPAWFNALVVTLMIVGIFSTAYWLSVIAI